MLNCLMQRSQLYGIAMKIFESNYRQNQKPFIFTILTILFLLSISEHAFAAQEIIKSDKKQILSL